MFMVEPGLGDKVKKLVMAGKYAQSVLPFLKAGVYASSASFLISNHAENMIGQLPFEKYDPVNLPHSNMDIPFRGMSVGLEQYTLLGLF